MALAFALGVVVEVRKSVEGWSRYQGLPAQEEAADRVVKHAFLDAGTSDAARFTALFQYMLRGFLAHSSPYFAAVHYQGFGGFYGYQVSGLEGFARTATLFAAWVSAGRGARTADPLTGGTIDLVDRLRRGILAGTDPAGPGYWGRIGDDDERIVDAADVARILWLTRDQLWQTLSPDEQRRIADWLLQVRTATTTHKNNWLLAPVIITSVLHRLGYFKPEPDLANYFEFKRAAYREQGWFSDPPEGVDFYNTWGTTYELFWIHMLNPDLDRAFITTALHDSAALTAHLIGPKGVPILGRSICYRTAVSVPLIADSLVTGDAAQAAEARRALDVVWRHFVAHDALRGGALTQGYYGADPRVLDVYTGPGSCQWGLRSLVLAFMAPPDAPLWRVSPAALPIEESDYIVHLPKIGWTIIGDRATGDIHVVIDRNTMRVAKLEGYTPLRHIAEAILQRPMRPENHVVKYELHEYSALNPFSGALEDGTAVPVH